jgi:hypothetical protein
MEQSEERVLVGHAGAGIPHNSSDLLPHIRFVTMHRAVGTGRLLLLEWTSIEALVRIRYKSLTLGAQSLFCYAMMSAAVDADHGLNGLMFPSHSGLLPVHGILAPHHTFNDTSSGITMKMIYIIIWPLKRNIA